MVKASLYNLAMGPDGLSQVVSSMPRLTVIPTLTKYGASIGKRTVIEEGLVLHRASKKKPYSNLVIGTGCFIGKGVFIDIGDRVVIADNTSLGAESMIWTHVGDYTEKLYGGDYKEKRGPVTINESTICYSRCIIGQGVVVGAFSRVGAGSVVLRDVETRTFVAGNPARVVRKLEEKQG